MKSGQLRRVLERDPLKYRVARQRGSHVRLESDAGYPPLTFAFHAGSDIPAGLVRKILINDVGLSVEEAEALL